MHEVILPSAPCTLAEDWDNLIQSFFFAKHHTLPITMTHTTIFAGLMMTITAGFRQDGFAPDKAGKNATSSWE